MSEDLTSSRVFVLAERLTAILVFPVVALVLLPLGLLIRLDSPGRALFIQERVGLHGRPFKMFKLRTMQVGSEDAHERLQAAALNQTGMPFVYPEVDERITRVGRMLRKTRLDELPQLVNVALGHMSLVGPRPMLPSELVHMPEFMKYRFSRRPGLTGPVQLDGHLGRDWEYLRGLEEPFFQNLSLKTYADLILSTIGRAVSVPIRIAMKRAKPPAKGPTDCH